MDSTIESSQQQLDHIDKIQHNSGCLINISTDDNEYPPILYDLTSPPLFPNTTLLQAAREKDCLIKLIYSCENGKRIEYKYVGQAIRDETQIIQQDIVPEGMRTSGHDKTTETILSVLWSINTRLGKIETHLKMHE